MTDSTEMNVMKVARRVPSKGFEVVLLPDVPFGPEVVLNLRGRVYADDDFAWAASADVKTDKPGEVDELSFLEVTCGAVIILFDLETAEAMCDALRFRQMDMRHKDEEASRDWS
jgi:hypothetical protein